MSDLDNRQLHRFWIASFLVLCFGRPSEELKQETRNWFSAQLAGGLNYVPLEIRADKDALGPYLVIEGRRYDPRIDDFRLPLLTYILRLYEEVKRVKDPELLRFAKRKLWQLFSVNELDLVLDNGQALEDIGQLFQKPTKRFKFPAVREQKPEISRHSVDCGQNKTCLASVAGLLGASGGGSVLVNVVNKGQMVSTPFLILLCFILLVLILLLVSGLYFLISRRQNKGRTEYQPVSQVEDKVKRSGSASPASLERGTSDIAEEESNGNKSVFSRLTEKMAPNGRKFKNGVENSVSLTSEEDKAFLAESERTSTPSDQSVNSGRSEDVSKHSSTDKALQQETSFQTVPKGLDTTVTASGFQRPLRRFSDTSIQNGLPDQSLNRTQHEGIIWNRFGHEPRTSTAIFEQVIRQPRAGSGRHNSHPRHRHEEAERINDSYITRRVEETGKIVTSTPEGLKEFQVPEEVPSIVIRDVKDNEDIPNRNGQLKVSSPFKKSLQNLLKRSTNSSSPARAPKKTTFYDAHTKTYLHSQTME